MPTNVRRRPPTQASPADRLKETVHRALWAFEKQPQTARLINVLDMSEDPLAAEVLNRLSQATSDAWDSRALAVRATRR